MKCPNCDSENPAWFPFCGHCGADLPAACPNCGFVNSPNYDTCQNCQTPRLNNGGLTIEEIGHLREYLPPLYIEAIDFNPVSPPPHLISLTIDHLSNLFNNLSAHLPAYVVENVVRNPMPGQAGGRFVEGALLFADVSGFTAMSEKLSRVGREGAEEITTIINRYFSAMLNILREHGGQLIQFGGDALLGLFIEPNSAARATLAGLKMQVAMAEFRHIVTSQGTFPLQMKVGIHRGRFFAALLGTAQRMTYALFGADVNATAAAESAAVAGQVLLSAAAFNDLGVGAKSSPAPTAGYFIIESLESPESIPAADPNVVRPVLAVTKSVKGIKEALKRLEAIVPYLPADLLSRLAGSGNTTGIVEGEHRLVSIVFTNVHGLGEIADQLGPGQEAQVIQAINYYFVEMERIIRSFGGVVNKIDLYDHGDKLLALFGAPIAHEDDAERATRSAFEMRQKLADVNKALPDYTGMPELHLEQQVGINYGYVFAGYVGNDWRREYTVMGDDVNLSARLMTAAQKGTIIVSKSVHRKAQNIFELTPQGEIKVKGKSDLIPIFDVTSFRPENATRRYHWSGVRSPLVGRRTEWEKLVHAMNLLSAGSGQIAFVIGEAGLGKSRLMDEIRAHYSEPDEEQWAGRWVEGKCLSYTESVSFLPFQELIRNLVGIHSEDDLSGAGFKLRDALKQYLPEDDVPLTLPYIANFLGLPLDEASQAKVRYLDAEALQRRIFVAISSLLSTYAKARPVPLVLVLEDIHWLDQASRALLEHLMVLTNRVPIMFILVYRPEREKICMQIQEKAQREYAHCATEVRLEPFTPAESKELLNNLAQTSQWPTEAYDRILKRTEGNPLYMEELIRDLIGEKILVQDATGKWQLHNLEALKVPDNLQGMLMARLDRLEEPPRRTAQVASVAGRVFPLSLISYIHTDHSADSAIQLGENLERLQEHEIVFEARKAPEANYSFKHGMMQEVYYASLLTRSSRQYHCRIAEYYEARTSPEEREANVAIIAHHAFTGQDWARGLLYQTQAGQRAQRLYANKEAIDHFTKALHSADSLPEAETIAQRQTLHSALGELLTTTGQYEPALEHLNKARKLYATTTDEDGEAHVCRWIGRLYELRGDYVSAMEWFQQGLMLLEERETPEAVQILSLAGLIRSRQGNHDGALEYCQRALQIAQKLGEVTALARAYTLMGHLMRQRGNATAAIENVQRSLDLYQRAGHIQGQALANNQLANAYFDGGQWKKADHHYRQAREMFDKMGNLYDRSIADNNLGGIAINQGRLDEAVTFFQEAIAALEKIGGAPYIIGVVEMNLGHAFIRRGEAEIAGKHLTLSQAAFDKAQARDFLPELYRYFAESFLLIGNLAEAERYANESLELSHELSMRGEEGSCFRVLGKIDTAQSQWGKAEEHLLLSVTILEEVGDEYQTALSRLSLVKAYVAQAKREQAQMTLDLCMRTFQRLEASLDLAVAQSLVVQLGGSTPKTS